MPAMLLRRYCWRGGDAELAGLATYANPRLFSVATGAEIGEPAD